MSNTNAVAPFNDPSLRNLADSLGITQFPSETNWWQTVGGLLIQGGLAVAVPHPGPTVIQFNVGFPIQCLGVFPQQLGTSIHAWSVVNVTKDQFGLLISNPPARDFYWWAIGV